MGDGGFTLSIRTLWWRACLWRTHRALPRISLSVHNICDGFIDHVVGIMMFKWVRGKTRRMTYRDAHKVLTEGVKTSDSIGWDALFSYPVPYIFLKGQGCIFCWVVSWHSMGTAGWCWLVDVFYVIEVRITSLFNDPYSPMTPCNVLTYHLQPGLKYSTSWWVVWTKML